jgi:hypothetical protein
MQFQWPDDSATRFRRDTLKATHDGHTSPLFEDDGLADLLDRYPREKLGVYKFPDHAEGKVKALHGDAPGVSGAQLLQAVKDGRIWLNLRAANRELPEYEDLKQQIFGQLESATGHKTLKQDVGVLISSPNIHVHYHLDIPLVCLVQMRGTKTLHLYPPEAPFAPPEQVECVALRETEEEITFQNSFDTSADAITLNPGDAITWPQNAPHRVQNADVMNVSLSCEFMTPGALLRANAIYTNGLLRRKLGWSPQLPPQNGVGVLTKAVLARGAKLVHRPPEKGPTPTTFRIDPNTGHAVDLTDQHA